MINVRFERPIPKERSDIASLAFEYEDQPPNQANQTLNSFEDSSNVVATRDARKITKQTTLQL